MRGSQSVGALRGGSGASPLDTKFICFHHFSRAPWVVARPLNLIEGGCTRYQVTAETISAQHHLKEQAIAKGVIDSQKVVPSAKAILPNEEH
jgi:hypothetical protein